MGKQYQKQKTKWKIQGLERALELLLEDKKIKEFYEFQTKLNEEIDSSKN